MDRRAVFLDRDGVLNRSVIRNGRPYAPGSVAEVEIPADVPEALETLVAEGLRLICVTNQPDVVRGTMRLEAVEEINSLLRARLPLCDLLVSYDDGDESPRRKPNPGMLLEAAERYDLDLGASFMVGDRWKDIEAGRRVGCVTILIDHRYDEPWPVGPPDHRASSLSEAAAFILRRCREGSR
jgi:D-glycero-D-manno-heptose 1,7-bisphosphate phosphatase